MTTNPENNLDELKREIKRLKLSIMSLKYTLEDPEYVCYSSPGEKEKLENDRQCLKEAIKAYRDAGGAYQPNESEIRAGIFDSRMDCIKSIYIKDEGFFMPVARKLIFDKDREEVAVFREMPFDEEGTLIPTGIKFERKAVLDMLKKLHVGEWDYYYDTEEYGYYAGPGGKWEFEVEYSDEEKSFESGGIGCHPFNYESVLELMGIDPADYEIEEEKPKMDYYEYVYAMMDLGEDR